MNKVALYHHNSFAVLFPIKVYINIHVLTSGNCDLLSDKDRGFQTILIFDVEFFKVATVFL